MQNVQVEPICVVLVVKYCTPNVKLDASTPIGGEKLKNAALVEFLTPENRIKSILTPFAVAVDSGNLFASPAAFTVDPLRAAAEIANSEIQF